MKKTFNTLNEIQFNYWKHWKCNFPKTGHVRASGGRSICFVINDLDVTLPCSNRSIFFLIMVTGNIIFYCSQ